MNPPKKQVKPTKAKRGRDDDEGAVGKEKGDTNLSPSKTKRVEINPIITTELGFLIAKAKKHRVSIGGMCFKVGKRLWEVFPNNKCG